MASVMGLMEEREAAAWVRMEEFQAEANRNLSELAAADVVLEHRAIARVELAEALSARDDAADTAVREAPEPVPAANDLGYASSVWGRCDALGQTAQSGQLTNSTMTVAVPGTCRASPA